MVLGGKEDRLFVHVNRFDLDSDWKETIISGSGGAFELVDGFDYPLLDWET